MNNLTSTSAQLSELKAKYIELITEGYVENVALEALSFPRGAYLRLMMEDIDFNLQVNEARKLRADFWVSKIAADLNTDYSKDEVPNQRLRFDKLQFLAKADNPDKYGNNSKSKIDINVDLTQFKLLPPDQALKALNADPFAPKNEAIPEVELVVKKTPIILPKIIETKKIVEPTPTDKGVEFIEDWI